MLGAMDQLRRHLPGDCAALMGTADGVDEGSLPSSCWLLRARSSRGLPACTSLLLYLSNKVLPIRLDLHPAAFCEMTMRYDEPGHRVTQVPRAPCKLAD